MGKPSVRDRKIVNTTDADGNEVGVNAQQYVVLVQDVPDLIKEHERAEYRSQNSLSWQKVFYSFIYFFETKVTHRKAFPFRVPFTTSKSRELPFSTNPSTYQERQRDVYNQDDIELGRIDSSMGVPGREKNREADDHEAEIRTPDRKPNSDKNADPCPNGMTKQDSRQEDYFPKVPPSPFNHARLEGSPARRAGASTTPEVPPLKLDDLHRAQAVSKDGVERLGPQELVEKTFRNLFPESFMYAVPVYKHKAVDRLLRKWDRACDQLEGGEAEYVTSHKRIRPVATLGWLSCFGIGEQVDKIDFFAQTVRRLEKEIPATRSKILAGPPCHAYFVIFNSQKDAAIAAQANIHPEDGNSFQIKEAPGPEEVNWSTLWMSYHERELREVLVLPLKVAVVLLPIGVFAGVVTQVNQILCGIPEAKNYCNSRWSGILVSVLPSILLSVWQQVVLPLLFYCFVLLEGRSVSLSGIDRRVASLYFFWNVFNVFLGGMLGGSLSRLTSIFVKGEINAALMSIGTALPSASNFFINFVILQGFGMVPLRILYPSIGVFSDLFRLMGIGSTHLLPSFPTSTHFGRVPLSGRDAFLRQYPGIQLHLFRLSPPRCCQYPSFPFHQLFPTKLWCCLCPSFKERRPPCHGPYGHPMDWPFLLGYLPRQWQYVPRTSSIAVRFTHHCRHAHLSMRFLDPSLAVRPPGIPFSDPLLPLSHLSVNFLTRQRQYAHPSFQYSHPDSDSTATHILGSSPTASLAVAACTLSWASCPSLAVCRIHCYNSELCGFLAFLPFSVISCSCTIH
eukprot:jgi/Botrbrau1/11349/Bobra.0038s0106.1